MRNAILAEREIYMLYGSKQSLFTRKLEAALVFYGARHELRLKRKEQDAKLIELRAGTHQVPVLRTPENWMIADTTPIMDMLDQRFPRRQLFPRGPLGVLAHIVEEHIDEWIARVMVHYRWHYPDSAAFASTAISDGNEIAAATVRQWGPRACRATGTETAFHQKAAEEEYERLLDMAEAQLGVTQFMLGDRPCVVDCALLGGLRAHILHDPDPRKILQKFPRVTAWAETRADAWDGSGDWMPFPDSTAFARHVLAELPRTYGPFLLANAECLAAGRKAFTIDTYGRDASYLARPYPEQSRAMIRERIAMRLLESERVDVDAWLKTANLMEYFAPI